jgi:hypothetical protein
MSWQVAACGAPCFPRTINSSSGGGGTHHTPLGLLLRVGSRDSVHPVTQQCKAVVWPALTSSVLLSSNLQTKFGYTGRVGSSAWLQRPAFLQSFEVRQLGGRLARMPEWSGTTGKAAVPCQREGVWGGCCCQHAHGSYSASKFR